MNVPIWKKVAAFIIDIVLAFFILGYLVAWITGGLTDGGFQLNGWPALLFFVLLVLYFIVFNKFLGGTIGKRLLGIRKQQSPFQQ